MASGGREGRFKIIETKIRQPIECSGAGRCGRGRIKSRTIEVVHLRRSISKFEACSPSSERRTVSTLSLVAKTAGLPPPSPWSPSNAWARCLPFFFLAGPPTPPAPVGCVDLVIEVLEGIRGERSGAITLKIRETRWVLWIGPTWRRFLRASRNAIWCALQRLRSSSTPGKQGHTKYGRHPGGRQAG